MGEKQIIISVSREFGSGGHEIARRIAEYMQLEFLDRNMIEMIAKEKLVDANNLHPYDEAPRFVPRRTVRGHSSSPEETIAQMQFEFLRKKAENGDSFVVVGRCSETVLKKYDCLTSIFVLGDYEKKFQLSKSRKSETVTPMKSLPPVKRSCVNNINKSVVYQNKSFDDKRERSYQSEAALEAAKVPDEIKTQLQI